MSKIKELKDRLNEYRDAANRTEIDREIQAIISMTNALMYEINAKVLQDETEKLIERTERLIDRICDANMEAQYMEAINAITGYKIFIVDDTLDVIVSMAELNDMKYMK